MMRSLQRPLLPTSVARAALAATKDDPLLYAATSLTLLAGLRPGEVLGLLARDWQPGEDPKLTVRLAHWQRTIRVALSVAAAIDDCRQQAPPEEPLLLGLTLPKMRLLVYRDFHTAMRQAGLDVRGNDLLQAAVAAVLDDGTPPAHISAYFSMSKAAEGKPLVPVREDYDRGIAAVLEATFAV